MSTFTQGNLRLNCRLRCVLREPRVESLEARRLYAATPAVSPTDDGNSLMIQGATFLDADGNGYRSSPDLPKAGRTVYIDENNDGSLDAAEPVETTDASGVFSFEGLDPGTYTVAAQLTPGEVQLAAAGLTDRANHFNIDLVFENDTSLTAAQQNVFTAAARRWEQVITGDLPQAADSGHVIDDLRIDVRTPDIDGSGGTFAQAAPTSLRQGSSLPYVGFIEADSSDLNHLTTNGQLYDVILHEMGHVLGIGTIWDAKGHLKGRGTSNVRFDGAAAMAAYDEIFSTTGAVPVEDEGGAGTRDTHWRDSVLDDELMTGFITSSANPLSRITIGALQDIGYRVSLSGADQYGPDQASVEEAGFGRAKVTIAAGESVNDIELSISTPSVAALPAGTASISGTVFDDSNGDGIRDPSDTGIAGATVFLDLNHNGRLERTEPTATSENDGTYLFANLAAQEYTVRTSAVSGYLRTGPQGLYHQLTVRGNQSADANDFGFARPGNIRGAVTVQTAVIGDGPSITTPLQGAAVFIDTNGDGVLTTGEKQTVTDADGQYQFVNLRPATQSIRLLAPAGYSAADPAKTVVLQSDETLTDQDFTLTILLA